MKGHVIFERFGLHHVYELIKIYVNMEREGDPFLPCPSNMTFKTLKGKRRAHIIELSNLDRNAIYILT